jgi:hypothetical protein
MAMGVGGIQRKKKKKREGREIRTFSRIIRRGGKEKCVKVDV